MVTRRCCSVSARRYAPCADQPLMCSLAPMQMEGQGVLTVEKLDGDCMMGADAAAAAPGGELAMEWEEDPDDEVP